MSPYESYKQYDCEVNQIKDKNTKICNLWTISGDKVENGKSESVKEKEYSYDEAIELAGTGWYTIGLLASLSLSLLSMSIDMFGLSTVVSLSSCDFQLTHTETHVLLSMPFIGAIVMAYAWGYVSDTQGRRRSLRIAMSVSFVMSVLCAFAPNWTTFAVFKFIGTCFCSCAQSVTYTLLGESCPERVKGTYLLVMTSVMHGSMGVYFTVSYFVGYLDFEYDLGFIMFVPWRLLVILLALPLGLSALALTCFYESPKFLLNAGREDEALVVLAKISRRNGNSWYPVRKVFLEEIGNVTQRSRSLVSSLWQQTVPLFKPPLLPRTILLYCLIFITYSSSSSLIVGLPFLANDFAYAVNSQTEEQHGICSLIVREETDAPDDIKCTEWIELPIVIFAVSVGATYSILNFVMSKLASRKKALTIVIFTFSSACCLVSLHTPNYLINIISYFGIFSDILCMGIVFTYCVEFFPTSFRGMASCLGVMVARISSIFGVNVIGSYFTYQCTSAFYSLCGLIFSGALLSCLLPSDTIKKM